MILPSGYTLLECIESTGTQYIDTGFVPNQDTRLVAKIKCVAGSSTVWALGARKSNTANMFCFIASASGYYMTQYATDQGALSADLNTSEPFIVEKNKNVTSINGETVHTSTAATFTCPVNLTLFAVNNNGTINKGSVSIYSCQIWDNGTLVRQYAPCINPDGEVGLYDVVEGKFYGNAGTGTFVAGDELLEVEYIESTGAQYIDTGFVPNQDTCIDMVVTPLSSENAGDGVGFIPYGAAQAYNDRAFECYSQNSKYEFNYDGQLDYLSTIEVGQKIEILHDKNNVSIITGDETTELSFDYETFTAPYTLTLFAIHRSSVICGLAKVYSCKVYDNGTLIRRYIPMVTGGGVAGLYDLVNNTFIVDAAGGNFFAGPRIVELPEGYTQVEYIEATGTQYIDTGVKPTDKTRLVWTLSNVTGNTYAAILTAPRYGIYVLTTGRIDMAFGDTGYTGSVLTGVTFPAAISIENGKVTANGVEATFTEQAEFTNARTLPLFGSNNAGTVTPYGTAYLHACRIYDAGVLVRDYIPCTNSSGAGGLYDLVTDTFYANAGTGTFTVGDVVDAESQIPGDETAPITPELFEEIRAVYLRWSEVDCEGYRIYRDGELVAETTNTFYADLETDDNETYTYTLTAYRGTAESEPISLEVHTKTGYFLFKPLIQSAFFQ